jgi:hypothetical protein
MVERYIVIALKIATTATKGCSITDSTIATTTTTTTISVVSIDRLFLFIRFILLACRESCIYIMKISRKISPFVLFYLPTCIFLSLLHHLTAVNSKSKKAKERKVTTTFLLSF